MYPVGRLDKDSEGLLLLTNDKSLNASLLSPAQKHARSYFVQVDNDITDKAIETLKKGVDITLDSGSYTTKPCSVKKLSKAPVLPERNPPIRVRQNIPTSWALIELTEGKNRQVRKMFASVGFPVLRLIRVQIEDLKIGKLEPGKYIEIGQEELFKLLKIEPSRSVRIPKESKLTKKEGSEKKGAAKKVTPSSPAPKISHRKKESQYSNVPKKKSDKPEKEAKPSFEKESSAKKPMRKKDSGHAPWQKKKGFKK